MPRGSLRIYLGAAPGVGKTYAMLDEARRRQSRGTDAVIAFVETHGRAATAAMIGDLEVIARRSLVYRDTPFEEMDLDAVLARRPQVACVDELAHSNVPGSRNEKRWEDVEELLAAGITVLSTINIQHLESLNDVVERITGVRQVETVPDEFVRAAEQVELVDLTPEALRRRMAHGNIYRPDKIDAALGNYFRVGNLTALRELALLWLADKVDDALQQYRKDHDIKDAWETRERVVVALTGGPEGETLIRRASRIATRGGAELLAVHVVRPEGLSGADPAALAAQRRLIESLGGSYHQVVGDRIAEALIEFARAENATQLVLGAPARRPFMAKLAGPGIGATTVRLSGDIDVHIVTHGEIGQGRGLPKLSAGLTWQRQLAGALLAALTLPVLTFTLTPLRQDLNLTSDLLAFLTAVVLVALLGGIYPGVAAALIASVLLNYFFTPPIHHFSIASSDNIIALAGFLIVGLAVSTIVDIAARRTSQAARASAESRLLAAVAGNALRGDTSITALLERLREALSLTSVTLLEATPDSGNNWTVVDWVGTTPSETPADGDAHAVAGQRSALVVRGKLPHPQERRVLGIFAAQAAAIRENRRREIAVGDGGSNASTEQTRTAILRSFDQTLLPALEAATTAVDALTDAASGLTVERRTRLLETAGQALHQLAEDIENRLELAWMRAGSDAVTLVPLRIDEILALALDAAGIAENAVQLDLPDSLPDVLAEPRLLGMVITDIARNTAHQASPAHPSHISAAVNGDSVEIRLDDPHYDPAVDPADDDAAWSTFLDETEDAVVDSALLLAAEVTTAIGGELVRTYRRGETRSLLLRLPVASARTGAGALGRVLT